MGRHRLGKHLGQRVVTCDLGEGNRIADIEDTRGMNGCEVEQGPGGIIAVDLIEETPAIVLDYRLA